MNFLKAHNINGKLDHIFDTKDKSKKGSETNMLTATNFTLQKNNIHSGEDYGAGIKTFRMAKNKITYLINIEDHIKELNLTTSIKGSYLKQSNGDSYLNKNSHLTGDLLKEKNDSSLTLLSSRLKSKHDYENIVLNQKIPYVIYFFMIFFICITLFATVLNSYSYISQRKSLNDSNSWISFLSDTNLKTFYIQGLLSNVIKMEFLRIGINTAHNMTNDEAHIYLSTNLEVDILKINNLDKSLQIKNHPIKPNKHYIDLLENNKTSLRNIDGSIDTENLYTGINMLLSKAHILYFTSNDNINFNNPDRYWVIQNGFNDLYISLINAAKYLINGFESYLNDRKVYDLALSVLYFIIILAVVFPIVSFVNQIRYFIEDSIDKFFNIDKLSL